VNEVVPPDGLAKSAKLVDLIVESGLFPP